MLIGYGQSCPGQEVFDTTIGACSCPPGMQPTGIVGGCTSASASVPAWGDTCPSYVPIVRGFQCNCPDGHAYDSSKNMCTREAFGPNAPPGPGLTKLSNGGPKVAGMGIGGWLLLAVAAGAAAYYLGSQY